MVPQPGLLLGRGRGGERLEAGDLAGEGALHLAQVHGLAEEPAASSLPPLTCAPARPACRRRRGGPAASEARKKSFTSAGRDGICCASRTK